MEDEDKKEIQDGETFSAKYKNSFARFTVEKRFSMIFSENCSGDWYDFVEKSIKETFPKTGDQVIPYDDIVRTCIEHAKITDKSLSENSSLKDFFYNAPFFEAEVLFYHLLLAQKNYHKNKFDFFANKKDSDYADKHESYRAELAKLFLESADYTKIQDEKERLLKQKSDLHSILHFSLTANTGDLSQLEKQTSDDVKILHDDTEFCFSFLQERTHKRFDIICDNSGAELFSDIYLAVFMLVHKYVKKVVLHIKPYPFFVSDATFDDFGKMLGILTKDGCNENLIKYLHEGKIEVVTHKFWAEPKYFDELPISELGFNKSDLLIVKGDLNYRRLVSDKKRKTADPFSNACLIKKTPVIAPRVLKSDVLVGIEPVFEAMAENEDKKFKTDGKWGVIQTTLPKKTIAIPVNDKNDKKNAQKTGSVKKNDKKTVAENLYFGILLSVLLLMIGILGIICIGYFSKNYVNFEHIEFSIILSALGMFVGGSVILPKFLLEREVKHAVQEYADNTVEIKTAECIEAQVGNVKNEITKTDAHLSRMVAFGLVEKFPIWSVGWAFRSLKRYTKLNPKKIKLKEYSDFVNFIHTAILENAIKNFESKINDDFSTNTNYKQYLDALYKEAESSHEKNPIRPAIRAIKDIADFEYSVCFVENETFKDNKAQLQNVCRTIGEFARKIAFCIMRDFSEKNIKQNKEFLTNSANEADEWLLNTILEISDFGYNSENNDASEQYKEKLKFTLFALAHEQLDSHDKVFFFKREEEDETIIK